MVPGPVHAGASVVTSQPPQIQTHADGLPLLCLEGSPATIGLQYGQAARGPIQQHVGDFLGRWCQARRRPVDSVRPMLDVVQGLYALYLPETLEEFHGISQGAGVGFEDVLAYNISEMLNGLAPFNPPMSPAPECTTLIVTPHVSATGHMIAGQNKDVISSKVPEIVILRIRPTSAPAVLTYAYWGSAEGPCLNDAGLVRFENSLFTTTKMRAERSVPRGLIKRMLNRCRTVRECLEVLDRLRLDGVLGFAGTLPLGDATGAAVSVETVPDQVHVIGPIDGVLVHANHVVCPELMSWSDRAATCMGDSNQRQARVESLLAAARPRIDLKTVQQALSDHERFPCSVCRHETPRSSTVASVICLPDQGALLATRGNPCSNPYVAYSLQDAPDQGNAL